MTRQLEMAIQTVKQLSMQEKIELLEVISNDLAETSMLRHETSRFWAAPTLSDLAARQGIPVVTDLRTLVTDFWSPDETADDLNNFVEERRRADRLSLQ